MQMPRALTLSTSLTAGLCAALLAGCAGMQSGAGAAGAGGMGGTAGATGAAPASVGPGPRGGVCNAAHRPAVWLVDRVRSRDFCFVFSWRNRWRGTPLEGLP